MEKRDPTETAKAAAWMRAAHLLLDDEPKILEDRVALSLPTPSYEKLIQEYPDTFRTREMNAFRTITVLRNRVDFGSGQASTEYFKGRKDGLRLPNTHRFMKATIPERFLSKGGKHP